ADDGEKIAAEERESGAEAKVKAENLQVCHRQQGRNLRVPPIPQSDQAQGAFYLCKHQVAREMDTPPGDPDRSLDPPGSPWTVLLGDVVQALDQLPALLGDLVQVLDEPPALLGDLVQVLDQLPALFGDLV